MTWVSGAESLQKLENGQVHWRLLARSQYRSRKRGKYTDVIAEAEKEGNHHAC